MNASYICKGIHKWIQDKEQYGEIHSVFKNAINILSEDGKFIPVVVKDKPMSPNSKKLEEVLDFNDLNITTGEKCIFTKTSLLVKNINISYEKVILWNKDIKLITNPGTYENFQIKLNLLKEFILSKGNKDGIFSLLEYIYGDVFHSGDNNLEDKSQLFIKERFIEFINSFEKNDINNINKFSKKIIGFGAGLTPSMDDFLSGMMIANIYASHYFAFNLENTYSLNLRIVKGIEGMTTLVSEEMLKLSSVGEANEDIRDLMVALFSTINIEKLNNLLLKVVNFGHSSGTDILCGICIGSYILMDKYEGYKSIYF